VKHPNATRAATEHNTPHRPVPLQAIICISYLPHFPHQRICLCVPFERSEFLQKSTLSKIELSRWAGQLDLRGADV
jgi:hypothetical protein